MAQELTEDEKAEFDKEFELVHGIIDQLVGSALDAGASEYGVASSLLWRGARLHEELLGAAETVVLLRQMAADIEQEILAAAQPTGSQH